MRKFVSCKECVDLLMDYLEGQLDPNIQTRLSDHLAECPPCINFLKTYKACSQLAERLRDQQVQIPLEVESRLKSFLKSQL